MTESSHVRDDAADQLDGGGCEEQDPRSHQHTGETRVLPAPRSPCVGGSTPHQRLVPGLEPAQSLLAGPQTTEGGTDARSCDGRGPREHPKLPISERIAALYQACSDRRGHAGGCTLVRGQATLGALEGAPPAHSHRVPSGRVLEGGPRGCYDASASLDVPRIIDPARLDLVERSGGRRVHAP